MLRGRREVNGRRRVEEEEEEALCVEEEPDFFVEVEGEVVCLEKDAL
jgi:hypothetical protein